MSGRFVRSTLAGALSLSLSLGGAIAAHASTAQPADVIYGSQWTVTSTSPDGETYSSWKRCGVQEASPTTSHLACTFESGTSVTVTDTVTGTQEVGDTTLSAAVGYEVTWSRQISIADTADVPKNTKVSLYYRETWKRTKVVQTGCQTVHGACDGVSLGTENAYTHSWDGMDWISTTGSNTP